jgi:hypothetical protein
MSPIARITATCMLMGALAAAVGCASKNQVLVPPRLDLARYGAIGIVEFSATSAPGHGPQATTQFVQMLQEAQPGAPILELGSRSEVLARVDMRELDFDAIRAIGDAYRVDAVFTGEVEMSEVKPNVQFGRSLTSMTAQASIKGQLTARLMETRAGATVWSKISESSANLARVGVGGGLPTFGVTAREDVESGLVGNLVSNISYDFNSHWVTE